MLPNAPRRRLPLFSRGRIRASKASRRKRKRAISKSKIDVFADSDDCDSTSLDIFGLHPAPDLTAISDPCVPLLHSLRRSAFVRVFLQLTLLCAITKFSEQRPQQLRITVQ